MNAWRQRILFRQFFSRNLDYLSFAFPKAPPKCARPSSSSSQVAKRPVFKSSQTSDAAYAAFLLSFLGFFEKKEDEESALITQIKRGVLAMQRSELDKAERIFHVALKTAQDLNEEDGVTYVFDMLANVAFQQGDYKKAELLFVEVLNRAIHQKKLPEDDNAIIDISLKLAKSFEQQNEREKAEKGYKFCLDAQEKKLNEKGMDVSADTKLLWAKASDWYAHFLMSGDRYEEAETRFRAALFVSEEVNGNNDPQTLIIMNDLAAALHLLEKDEEAIELLRQAIAMGKKVNADELPTYYVNLGAIHFSKQLLHLAEQYCRSGLNLAIRLKDKTAEKEAKHCLSGVELAKKIEKAKEMEANVKKNEI